MLVKVTTYRPPGAPSKDERDRAYDRTRRDPEMKAFYDSAVWRRFRRWVLAARPACEECIGEGLLTEASHVHHKQPARGNPELRLDPDNVLALCGSCHARIEARLAAERGQHE